MTCRHHTAAVAGTASTGLRAVLHACMHAVCFLVQVSTVLGAALEEQRKEGEYIEGVAIWVAVAIVIMVGEQHMACASETGVSAVRAGKTPSHMRHVGACIIIISSSSTRRSW
jgi:ABC-type transport system involved in cytochrome c biogenesis permease subunit